jgi:heparan-alpha-glucosaminide N-acetyltransferase
MRGTAMTPPAAVPTTAHALETAPPAPAAVRSPRLLSVDLVRGLDVLLMLFVNEMAGVTGTPAFLRHVPANADGMTITDVVFPAFLFITGMAIPLAVGARLRRGHTRAQVWWHIVTRSLALVVIGVFMVNAEHGAAPGLLSPHAWNVLMTLAVLLVWQSPVEPRGRVPRGVVAGAGIACLIVLAFLYRSAEVSGIIQLRPQWWGILGLIGWAYLTASTVYLFAGNRPGVLLGAAALLYALYFADALTVVPWLAAVRPYFHLGSAVGSHGALVLTGTVLSAWLARHRGRGEPMAAFLWRAAAYGAVLAGAGLVLHQFRDVHQAFWINKPMATPAWCLISGAWTVAAWAVWFFVADVRGWRRWPAVVTIAGENALLTYLLAPWALSLLALSAAITGGVNLYGALGDSLAVGTVRSIVFAGAIVWLCGWLRARGVRVHI